MIRLLIKKELKEFSRSSALPWIFLGVFILLALAAYNGYTYYTKHHQLLTEAQATSYEQFINQGDKDPHTGAHFGFYAFKPTPQMAIIENGIDDFTGTSFYLEPHKRGTVKFKGVIDATGLKRFGFLTIGYFTQFILPLFIFIICYNIFAKEWENGTIKILLSTHIKSIQLFTGKLLACLLIVFSIVLTITLILFLLLSSTTATFTDNLIPVLLYLLSLSIFAVMITILGVCISLLTRNSSIALITLAGFWLTGVFLLPRAAAEIAKNVYPSITSMEFDNRAEYLKLYGMNSEGTRDYRRNLLIQATLKEYKVKRLEDLPINFIPISIEYFEDSDARIMNQLYASIDQNFEKQNRFVALSMILSPFNAFRNISMAICGTDSYSHQDFTKKAEDQRMKIQSLVDTYYVHHTKASKTFWKTIPQFTYQAPSVWERIKHEKIQLFTLFGWMAFSILLMINSIKRIKA